MPRSIKSGLQRERLVSAIVKVDFDISVLKAPGTCD